MFSKRKYSTCDCALESDRMSNMLVTFYVMITKMGYYLNRWTEVLDVTAEKIKGPS